MSEILKEWAKRLNGRKTGNEMSIQDLIDAAKQGVVIVLGYSDDLCEFYGVLWDELDCFDGADIYIYTTDNRSTYLISPSLPPAGSESRLIKAVWCAENEPC